MGPSHLGPCRKAQATHDIAHCAITVCDACEGGKRAGGFFLLLVGGHQRSTGDVLPDQFIPVNSLLVGFFSSSGQRIKITWIFFPSHFTSGNCWLWSLVYKTGCHFNTAQEAPLEARIFLFPDQKHFKEQYSFIFQEMDGM